MYLGSVSSGGTGPLSVLWTCEDAVIGSFQPFMQCLAVYLPLTGVGDFFPAVTHILSKMKENTVLESRLTIKLVQYLSS